MSPKDHRKQFLTTFNRIASHRSRFERFADFLELASCAIRKTTIPPGPDADALEQRYMQIVGRYPPDDIRAMPELLALTQLAVATGGCDFLGEIVQELELLDPKLGQFITPYDVSRLIAEITLQDAAHLIVERGFITVQEPASGAGGMVIAAADVIEKQGFDPQTTLYVHAIDVASLCFHMTYVQLAARSIPATVVHGNTLSQEFFESARTPAFFPFFRQHSETLMRWHQEARQAQPAPSAAPPSLAAPQTSKSNPVQGDLFAEHPDPEHQTGRPRRSKEPGPGP